MCAIAVQVAYSGYGEGHRGVFYPCRFFLEGDDEGIIVHYIVEIQVGHTALVLDRSNLRSHESIFHNLAVFAFDACNFHSADYGNGIGYMGSREFLYLGIFQ